MAVVGYFEANAIGVSEERGPVIGRVLRIELCFRCFDPGRTKLVSNSHNVSDRLDAKAKMMKAGRIGVVPVGIARRTKNITEMTIEVLDVWITAQSEFVLSETKHLKQDVIVERLRALEIGHSDVDMVNSGDFSHGAEM